jgi:hypothetical protein
LRIKRESELQDQHKPPTTRAARIYEPFAAIRHHDPLESHNDVCGGRSAYSAVSDQTFHRLQIEALMKKISAFGGYSYDSMGKFLRQTYANQMVVFGFAFNQGSFQAMDMSRIA